MRSLAILLAILLTSQLSWAEEAKIVDADHYSHVFGEIRNYRIHLPPSYDVDPQRRYPVIYFFHGWQERYFGVIGSNPYEQGDDNGGDNIAAFVSKHDVIVVKWDGFNPRPDEDYAVTPYNVGRASTSRQFPLYFPELMEHIDANYRTLADRNHRAVSGLSMGGFMALYIGGKYPHLVCAAGSFCGSPEYMLGPNDFRSHYRHTEMYNNYAGMKVRFHNGTQDTLRSYHADMDRTWLQVMDNYEHKFYDAGHVTCGMGDMFSFFLETFADPPPVPERWHHTDVYPNFSTWGYDVQSDRFTPGLTTLENVDPRGFRSSIREFLPHGELLAYVQLVVTTSPIYLYRKNTDYFISDINLTTGQTSRRTIQSDSQGRLRIALDGQLHEIGINLANDTPNVALAEYAIDNLDLAVPMKNIEMSISLLNKGRGSATGVTGKLAAIRDSVEVLEYQVELGDVAEHTTQKSKSSFVFRVNDASLRVVRFRLTMADQENHTWHEDFEVPIESDQRVIEEFEIADGRVVRVADAGTFETSMVLGVGNGDGIANPGESIVILVKDQIKISYSKSELSEGVERWIRTRADSSSKYVNAQGEYLREKDEWHRFDSVGGSAKISIPTIAADCPEGTSLTFFVEYWKPDPDQYRCHDVERGVVHIRVAGADKTPPVVRWAKVNGNNVLTARVMDGGSLDYVRATLHPQNEERQYMKLDAEPLTFSLADDGEGADSVAGDGVFTAAVPRLKLRLYKIQIEASDAQGNTTSRSFDEIVAVQ